MQGARKTVNILKDPMASWFHEELQNSSVVHILDTKTMVPCTDAVATARPWRFMPKVPNTRLKEVMHCIFGNPRVAAPAPVFGKNHCVVILDGRSAKTNKEVYGLLSKCLKNIPKDFLMSTLQACHESTVRHDLKFIMLSVSTAGRHSRPQGAHISVLLPQQRLGQQQYWR